MKTTSLTLFENLESNDPNGLDTTSWDFLENYVISLQKLFGENSKPNDISILRSMLECGVEDTRFWDYARGQIIRLDAALQNYNPYQPVAIVSEL